MKEKYLSYFALLLVVFVSLIGVSYADRSIDNPAQPLNSSFNAPAQYSTQGSCPPAKIVSAAYSQIGKTFKDNQTPYGNDGHPFCAFFAVWAYKKAGCSPLPSDKSYEGSSKKLLEWFAASGNSPKHIVFTDVSSAQPGDIIVWKRTSKDGGHTGIVWYNNPAYHKIWLIEANVHDDVRANAYDYSDIPTRGGMQMKLYGFGRW